MKTRAWLLAVGLLFAASASGWCQEAYYKKADYVMSPRISSGEAELKRKFDLLILDIENWANNPGTIREIMAGNQRTKVFVYTNPMEYFSTFYYDRPWGEEFKALVYDRREGFQLRTDQGQHAIFYQKAGIKMEMFNVSTLCPKVDGERYNMFYARWLVQKFKSMDPKPHGWFIDNPAVDVAWMNENNLRDRKLGRIDADLDGVAESRSALDSAWADGWRELIDYVQREMGTDFIIIGNRGVNDFPGRLRGRMFENMPFDWSSDQSRPYGGVLWNLENAEKTGEYTIFHTPFNSDFQEMRYRYALAAIADVYFCAEAFAYWVDEFPFLGRPAGPMTRNGEWLSRPYSGGLLRVNIETREVIFPQHP